jgi:hypothetical protein
VKLVKPVININDPVARTVGRRTATVDPLEYAAGLQRTLNQLAPLRVPKGVFRFNSHEEADQWLMDHLTRKREN